MVSNLPSIIVIHRMKPCWLYYMSCMCSCTPQRFLPFILNHFGHTKFDPMGYGDKYGYLVNEHDVYGYCCLCMFDHHVCRYCHYLGGHLAWGLLSCLAFQGTHIQPKDVLGCLDVMLVDQTSRRDTIVSVSDKSFVLGQPMVRCSWQASAVHEYSSLV